MATANLVLDDATGRWNLVFEGKVITGSISKYYVRQQVRQGRWKALGIDSVTESGWASIKNGTNSNSDADSPSVVGERFGINERFDFVRMCAQAIGKKNLPSLILTGQGGLGKTHTVINALNDAGLKDLREVIGPLELSDDEELAISQEYMDTTYTVIKGYSSARGLFNILYENRDRVLVFDDCDSILKDENATNLLKAALDSYDERWITWNASPSFGDNYPRTFKFTGSVIFISNWHANRIDQSIRSRAVCIDLTMTTDQIIERMTHIALSKDFMPTVSLGVKKECLDLISTHKDQVRTLSLRTLINVIKLRGSCNDWKRLAEYVISE